MPQSTIDQAVSDFTKLQEQLKQVESNYDALMSPMPCGHLARYAAINEYDTEYCSLCQIKLLEEKIVWMENKTTHAFGA